MPFGNPKVDPAKAKNLDHIYEEWIKPTVESVHILGDTNRTVHCHRADKDARSGEIIMHIIEHLLNADIVIADLSGRNANVFYELGVRHSLRKTTVLIADNLDDIPFDIRGLRAIAYEYEPAKLVTFRRELKDAVEAAVTNSTDADNPVARFLLDREVQKLRASNVPIGYDIVREILTEMHHLKDTVKDQAEDLRKLAEGIAGKQKTEPKPQSCDRLMASLQGLWRVSPSNSLVCIRMINGQLFAPYCYGGDASLTSRYFNFRRVGRTLFARFEWFISKMAGYGMFQIVSNNKIEGGWWFDEDVPENVRRGTRPPDGTLAGMSPIVMVRLKGREDFPDWAENYFKQLKTRSEKQAKAPRTRRAR